MEIDKYTRLHNYIAENFCGAIPDIQEMDTIIEIVKADFLTPLQPIEFDLVVNANGNNTCTNTQNEKDKNIYR